MSIKTDELLKENHADVDVVEDFQGFNKIIEIKRLPCIIVSLVTQSTL